jgi:protease-4
MSQPSSILGKISHFLTKARVFTANALFVLVIAVIATILLTGGDRASVPGQAALVLNPQGSIVEQELVGDPLTELLAPAASVREVEVGKILRALETATKDARITTVVLDLDELTSISAAHAQTIGEALQEIRAQDKQVIAFGSHFSQGQYLLASFANAIYLHPYGQFLPTGYGINQLYFNGLLNKLGVNIHVFRVGKYKEFVEPYTRTSMSDEAREANQTLVNELWNSYRQQIAENRRLSKHEISSYVDDFATLLDQANGDMARVALEHKVVDELLTADQARARIADRVGYDSQGNFSGIDYQDYLAAIGPRSAPSGSNQIGVITARGPIVGGANGRGVIAAEDIVELIRAARLQEDIKALVVRIDSPGGSAFASELIREELELTQLAGKPVVISMGNVAASGGYWIAATADAIYAQATTITGSIGIFGIAATLENSLAEIGVQSDGVGTTSLSRTMDPLTGINAVGARILQANVEDGYTRFLALVARGRDMSLEAVDAIAQGRVWTGQAAYAHGLVDEVGNLQDAIAGAAVLAELEDFTVNRITRQMSAEELLIKQLRDRVAVSTPISGPISEIARAWRQVGQVLQTLNDPAAVYALCLSCSLNW